MWLCNKFNFQKTRHETNCLFRSMWQINQAGSGVVNRFNIKLICFLFSDLFLRTLKIKKVGQKLN